MRKVFFSFHYTRDSWRAGQVRNSNLITNGRIQTSEFIDSVAWEKVKKLGDDNIRRWINNQLNNTSVTIVLIGSQTSNRRWVKYEIDQSLKRKNGLLGIHIHNVKDQFGLTDNKGRNPFNNLFFERNFGKEYLSDIYSSYDWVLHDGRNNFGQWIEQAATKAGR